jgi:hypothetical protein
VTQRPSSTASLNAGIAAASIGAAAMIGWGGFTLLTDSPFPSPNTAGKAVQLDGNAVFVRPPMAVATLDVPHRSVFVNDR